MKDPTWNIVLPQKLSTNLTELRNDPDLYQDVWISTTDDLTHPAPPWLADAKVRIGTRALLKLDRCAEEQRRLTFEADHLCDWFGKELHAIDVGLLFAQGAHVFFFYNYHQCS
jgi:hypothetical protein